MVTGHNALDDLDTVFTTNMPDGLSNPQPHITLKHLVAVLGDPYEVIAVMKRAVLSFVVLHDHTLFENELITPSGGSYSMKV